MKLTKKADGLSLTTVVIAALALLVLVVLILIFTGRIGIFRSGMDDCPPNSRGPLPDGCDGQIPVKIVRGSDGGLEYCCPVESEDSGTVDDDS